MIMSLVILMFPTNIQAETQTAENITIIPINEEIRLQKITTTMNIPESDKIHWGIIKGEASDYVERYPVIIQFFKGDELVHISQVSVKGDGSFEYQFKVRDMSTNGNVINIFEGQYAVEIFKVIHNV